MEVILKTIGLNTLKLLLVAVALGVAGPVSATVYYVSPKGSDSQSGTQAAPWRTILKAAQTLVAGDTAIIMDGTYVEGEVYFWNPGTADKPITIKAQNRHKAILSSTSNCHPNISLYASYITIEGLRSTIDPSNVPCVPLDSASGAAVRAWSQTNPTVTSPNTSFKGCVIRDMLVDASPARGVGIKINQDECLVENSEIHSSLCAFNNKGTIFRNNTIIGADIWGTSIFGKSGVRNFQVYNNVVRVPPGAGQGIVLGGVSGADWFFDPATKFEAYNSVAYNNVVINESGGIIDGLLMLGAKDSAFFNNVVIEGQVSLAPSGAIQVSNPTIKNNIVQCKQNALGTGTWKYSGTLNIDYNNFYNCYSPPKQNNPVVGVPDFVDPKSDWHIKPGSTSTVLNTGTAVTFAGYAGEQIDVTKDKDGFVRGKPWGIGIYTVKSPPLAPALQINPQ